MSEANPMDEKVACINASLFRELFPPTGNAVGWCDVRKLDEQRAQQAHRSPRNDPAGDLRTMMRYVNWLRRGTVEEDPSFRHLITYVVVVDGHRVLSYRRGKSGGEKRLHGALSIGVGGHIALSSNMHWSPEQLIVDELMRELNEELAWDTGIVADIHVDQLKDGHVGDPLSRLQFHGSIAVSFNASPVDMVHTGLCFTAITAKRPKVREDCLADPEWLYVQELIERQDELESWSKIVLEQVLIPNPLFI